MAMVLRHQQVLGVNGHCVSAPAGDDGVDCEGFFFFTSNYTTTMRFGDEKITLR